MMFNSRLVAKHIDTVPSESNDNGLDLWNLALYKRKLQMQGVYPIVVMQNGKLVRMFVNRRLDSSNGKQHSSSIREEVRVKKEQTMSQRRGKSIRHTNLNQLTLPLEANKIKRKDQLNTMQKLKSMLNNESYKRIIESMTTERSIKMTSMVTIPSSPASTTLQTTTTMKMDSKPTIPLAEVEMTGETYTSTYEAKEIVNSNTVQSTTSNDRDYEDSSDVVMSTTIGSSTTTNESNLNSSEMSLMISTESSSTTTTVLPDITTTYDFETSEDTIQTSEQQADSSKPHIYTSTAVYTSDWSTTSMASDSFETTTLLTQDIDEITIFLKNFDETTDSMDYVADESIVNVPTESYKTIKEMSYFADDNFDSIQDEYKMDQLASMLVQRVKLNQFTANEKLILRSMFRNKWQQIRKEAQDLRIISKDNNSNFMKIVQQ